MGVLVPPAQQGTASFAPLAGCWHCSGQCTSVGPTVGAVSQVVGVLAGGTWPGGEWPWLDFEKEGCTGTLPQSSVGTAGYVPNPGDSCDWRKEAEQPGHTRSWLSPQGRLPALGKVPSCLFRRQTQCWSS